MKNTAHNLNEIKALLKESIISGDFEKHNGTHWYLHSGPFICRSIVTEKAFHLEICMDAKPIVETSWVYEK
jgi:hypothetical protein